MSSISKAELKKEVMKQHKSNQKLIHTIKQQLNTLKSSVELTAEYISLFIEQGGELHDLDLEHISIAKDYKHLASRSTLDKTFLETLGIIHRLKSNKIKKPPSTHTKSGIYSVGQIASKIKGMGKLRVDEKVIMIEMLEELKNNI